jgi:hypothetical protein
MGAKAAAGGATHDHAAPVEQPIAHSAPRAPGHRAGRLDTASDQRVSANFPVLVAQRVRHRCGRATGLDGGEEAGGGHRW